MTGFAIGYQIDRPDNAGEYTDLRAQRPAARQAADPVLPRLRPRPRPPGHRRQPAGDHERPGVQQAQPGAQPDHARRPARRCCRCRTTPTSSSSSPDYIAHDQDAMAFIGGKPDPWGMVVNPAYKNLEPAARRSGRCSTPTSRRPQSDCRQDNPRSTSASSPRRSPRCARSPRRCSTRWPNVQTRCDFDTSTDPLLQARPDRPAVVRLPLHARHHQPRRRGALRAAHRGPADQDGHVRRADRRVASARRVQLSAADEAVLAVRARPGRRPQVAHAYPGTMVVYTAARLQNLAQEDAAKVAQFIRVSTTEGQRPGSGNGELPDGFLPIRRPASTRQALRLGAGGRRRDRGPEAARTGRAADDPSGTGGGTPRHRRRPSTPPDDVPRRRRRRPRHATPVGGARRRRRRPSPMPATEAVGSDTGRRPAAAADPARRDRLRRATAVSGSPAVLREAS